MPHRMIAKVTNSDILTTPVTGLTTSVATVSAGWASYYQHISTVAGIIAALTGIVLSIVIIRLNLAKLRHSNQTELDRQQHSALARRKIELEIKNLKVSVRDRDKEAA